MATCKALIRQRAPLVYAITNFVTMDWVARGLLAAGARPVMARAVAEAEVLGASAQAVLLNMGTWTDEAQSAMVAAGRAANAAGVPVVLDPVGAGGLANRTARALELLRTVRVTVIRGNAGEIAALAGESGKVRGVDAQSSHLDDVISSARYVARQQGCVVAATGAIDVITDGTRTLVVHGGHPWMSEIPGAGCLGGALIAAALGSDPAVDLVGRVAEALLLAGYAGERAAAAAKGPGSFASAYLDSLAETEDLPTGRIARPLSERLSLYVLVDGRTPLTTVEAALAGGAGAIQLREKRLPLPDQLALAAQIRNLCRQYDALFFINDRVDLALLSGADGVHVGQDDLPVAAARRLLGPSAIIGASCATPDEAAVAFTEGADYIGTGAIYATTSKADAGEPIGPTAITAVRKAARIPVVGIGGVAFGNAAPVIRAGGCGVAVISAVTSADDPGAAARTLLAEVLAAKGEQHR